MLTENTEAVSWLNAFAKNYRRSLLILTSIKTMALCWQVACFWCFSMLMSQIIEAAPTLSEVYQTGFAVCAVAWVVTRQLAVYLQQNLTIQVERNLEKSLHRQWHSQQVALTRQRSSYFWQQLVLTHIPAISLFVSHYQVQKWLSGLLPLAVLIVIFPLNWVVATLLLMTLPIVPLFMVLVGKGAASLHRKHFVALERLGSQFTDRVKGLALITTFNRHGDEKLRLAVANERVNTRTMAVVSVAFLSNTVLDFFSTVSMALIAVFIGFSLLNEIQLGPSLHFQTGLFLLLVSPLLFSELKTLGRFYHQKANAESAASALQPVLRHKILMPGTGAFSGISWINFHDEQALINAPYLSIMPGDKIALTGASGAGKSVMFEALMGMRNASHQLGSKAVMINQSSIIAATTLRGNLTMGFTVKEEDLWQQLERVGLTGWAQSLPQQLDTPMGEHPPLSGGQAQRLCLARVLLMDAEIIFLDEPTAHLTEQQHNALTALICGLLHDKTVIWASHKSLPETWFNRHWEMQKGRLTCT